MNYALLVLLAFVLASCSAYKQVPYLQASEYLDTSGQNTPLYDARIMPKDLLTITVNTTDPETAAPFNLTVATAVSNQNRSLRSQPVLQTTKAISTSPYWAACTSADSPRAKPKTSSERS